MGWSPFVKITDHSGGLSPQKFLYWLCFSKFIDLAFKVFCIAKVNFAPLHVYRDISNC